MYSTLPIALNEMSHSRNALFMRSTVRKQLAKVYSPNAAVRFVPRPLARYTTTWVKEPTYMDVCYMYTYGM